MFRHRILPVSDVANVAKVLLTQGVSKGCLSSLVKPLGSAFVVDLALAIAGGAPACEPVASGTDGHCSPPAAPTDQHRRAGHHADSAGLCPARVSAWQRRQ
jgi:hypothetical protein